MISLVQYGTGRRWRARLNGITMILSKHLFSLEALYSVDRENFTNQYSPSYMYRRFEFHQQDGDLCLTVMTFTKNCSVLEKLL